MAIQTPLSRCPFSNPLRQNSCVPARSASRRCPARQRFHDSTVQRPSLHDSSTPALPVRLLSPIAAYCRLFFETHPANPKPMARRSAANFPHAFQTSTLSRDAAMPGIITDVLGSKSLGWRAMQKSPISRILPHNPTSSRLLPPLGRGVLGQKQPRHNRLSIPPQLCDLEP
jgi:hypothetical protein